MARGETRTKTAESSSHHRRRSSTTAPITGNARHGFGLGCTEVLLFGAAIDVGSRNSTSEAQSAGRFHRISPGPTAHSPGEDSLERGHWARVSARKGKPDEQELQWDHADGEALKPEQGLAAGKHRAADVRW